MLTGKIECYMYKCIRISSESRQTPLCGNGDTESDHLYGCVAYTVPKRNDEQLKSFLSLHRFIVLILSFYRCRLSNLSFFPSIALSFYRFIVLSFFGKKHGVYSIVLSL